MNPHQQIPGDLLRQLLALQSGNRAMVANRVPPSTSNLTPLLQTLTGVPHTNTSGTSSSVVDSSARLGLSSSRQTVSIGGTSPQLASLALLRRLLPETGAPSASEASRSSSTSASVGDSLSQKSPSLMPQEKLAVRGGPTSGQPAPVSTALESPLLSGIIRRLIEEGQAKTALEAQRSLLLQGRQQAPPFNPAPPHAGIVGNSTGGLSSGVIQQRQLAPLMPPQRHLSLGFLQELHALKGQLPFAIGLPAASGPMARSIISTPQDSLLERLSRPALPQAQQDLSSMGRGSLATSSPSRAQKTEVPGTNSKTYEGETIIPVSLDSERSYLSEYQSLFREQLVFVETSHPRNGGKAQGRSKLIQEGQVGLLCRHCAKLPHMSRAPGSLYYPHKLDRLYQASVNMYLNHFETRCSVIPEQVRQRLKLLKGQRKMEVGGGKTFWANSAQKVGVREGEEGLVLDRDAHAQYNMKKRGAEQMAHLCHHSLRPQKVARVDLSTSKANVNAEK